MLYKYVNDSFHIWDDFLTSTTGILGQAQSQVEAQQAMMQQAQAECQAQQQAALVQQQWQAQAAAQQQATAIAHVQMWQIHQEQQQQQQTPPSSSWERSEDYELNNKPRHQWHNGFNGNRGPSQNRKDDGRFRKAMEDLKGARAENFELRQERLEKL